MVVVLDLSFFPTPVQLSNRLLLLLLADLLLRAELQHELFDHGSKDLLLVAEGVVFNQSLHKLLLS